MYRDALEAFEKALEKNPGLSGAWFGKGNALYDVGKFSEARDVYDAGLRIDPENAVGWTRRGMSIAGLKDQKAAIESYDRALAIDPSFSIAYFTRGSAFEALGQFEDAAESFRAMISLTGFCRGIYPSGTCPAGTGKIPGSPYILQTCAGNRSFTKRSLE